GLLDVVSDWLPNVEHKKGTRHVFANFKKKLSGVQLQRLFWLAAGTTVEPNFYNKMEQIKAIHPEAYDYLRKWHCRKYRITPTIKKRLEAMIKEQRFWTVIPSSFQELEVRKGDKSFGVNLHLKECMCMLWELSGIPCVHSVAAYLFLNKEPDEGVYHCRGLGEPSGGLGEANNERGEESSKRGQASGRRGQAGGGKGRARGRGGRSGRVRGRGSRGQRKGGRGRNYGTNMLVDEQYMEKLLIKEDEKRIAAEKAMQEEFDKEGVRLTLEEEARFEKEYQDRLREEEEFEFNKQWYNHDILSTLKFACIRVEGVNVDVQPQESIVNTNHGQAFTDKGQPGWRLTVDELYATTKPSVAAT
ncbi:splicing factor, partial [Tanacetum coccineum]